MFRIENVYIHIHLFPHEVPQDEESHNRPNNCEHRVPPLFPAHNLRIAGSHSSVG